jgi:HD-GYP domain-containing protein (c-di-GMP phosphodiesterase class II)
MDLIGAHQGMFFTCRYDGVWTMEYVSEGCTSLTGYQPIDLIHNQQVSYGQLIDPADREGIVNGLKASVLAGQRYDLVYRIRTRDGQEKWVRESGRCKMLTENSAFFTEGLVTDITDLKRSQERIQRQAMRLEALHKIDIAIMSSFDLRITLDLVLEQATTHLGLDASYILLFDPLTQTLEYTAWHGPCASPWRSKKMRIGEGLAGKTALERRPLCIDDLQSELNDPAFASSTGISSFVTYCSVPLIAKGQLKGVLEGFHRQPIQRDDDWANYLDALANQAAIAIDNISMFDELQRSNAELSLAYDATLEGWSKALELRDRETEGHTQRVTQMTLRLGRAVGMTPSELISVYRGALLHDIGKMGIPDQILLKAGPLDAEEWDVMRQHPLLAYQLLSTIPSLRPALDIPYCHHEKWDGSGYPRGLKGDQIPLPARIFAVVDVWDALTTDRPYRAAWSAERAIEYIREQSGSHFDSQVVEVFLLLYDSGQVVRYDGLKKAKAKATLLSM